MANAFLYSILSHTSQLLGFVQRWAVSPSSSSDPRSSVFEDLMELERTLKRIQAVLHDAEEREIREEAVKLWLKELKEVAYDAEDVLDECHYVELRAEAEGRASRKRKRVEGNGEEEVSGSLPPTVVSIPEGMGDRIRKIRERFDEISNDRERLHLREEDGERRVFKPIYPAPTSHMVDESSIYGREHDKKELIELLLSEAIGNGISVIPIVGKGGLGKTTIAQLVYKDSKVKEYFDLSGWVCVSDDFDVTRLTKAIIESLTQRSCDLTQLSTLQNTLEQEVKGKRVLLVLDDVWNEQRSLWESLRIPFVGAEMVSIIVTCRNDSVAEIMQTVGPHHPGYLSEDESWLLFKHYAFGGRDFGEQPHLVDIGKQIVRKCSGLPLALKTVGSLLRHMTDEVSWMDVSQSDLWEIDKEDEILPALRLSYIRMPAHLKPCFIYCSMFPKDYEFDKDVLVRLWMAQGYIPPRGRRMEDIGNEYFNDLLRRSFFDSFHFSKFKMHDMIHDLAKSIGNECYSIMDKKSPSFPDKVRHLYVQGDEESLIFHYNLTALRTLIVLEDRYRDKEETQEVTRLPLLRPGTTCLRTLEFYCKSEDGLPDSLGYLKHLRYLHIRSSYIWRLPKSLCLLYHLQTLILDCEHAGSVDHLEELPEHPFFLGQVPEHLGELPDGLGNLTNLRYFKLSACCIKRLPESVCLLHHLQTLILHCHILEEIPDGLGNLTNVRYIELWANHIKRLPESVCLLHHLQTLILHCRILAELPDGMGNLTNLRYSELWANCIKRLPESVCLLHHLQTLILDCGILAELPDGLGNLTNLLHFELRTNCIKRLPGSFCQLHNLHTLNLYGCKGLEELPIGSLTNLCHINIYQTGIGCLPVGIEKLTNLQKLFGFFDVRRGREQRGIEVLKDLVKLKGTLHISGLSNLVDIENARDASLKYKPELEELHLDWDYALDYIGGSLSIKEASPEENKDVPADEKREEAILEYLQPHPNLRELHIGGYGGSKFPKWVGNPFLFASLQAISIINCKNVKSLPLYIHSALENIPRSMLKRVNINSCWQLTSMAGLHNLHLLKDLYIKQCQQLTSLSGMQNLTSLRELFVKNCPKLHITAEDRLLSMPDIVEIVDCPGLVNWCQIQNINCIQVVSGNKLTISNTWENIKHVFNDLTSINLGFSNRWQFLRTEYKREFEELRIWSCMHIPPAWLLPVLTSLQSLVIEDCPGIQVLPDEMLPSMLKSLVVDSCENLRSLQLGQKNRDAFEKLQIVNCPKLTMVEGLNDLFIPKFLRIKQCPQLPLSLDD